MSFLYSGDSIEEMFPIFRSMRSASPTLADSELKSMKAGVRRVYNLMRGGSWHYAADIRLAAGSDGFPASEGLRRMRELRQFGIEIERERIEGTRHWRYRLVSSSVTSSSGDDLFRRLP